MRYHHHTTLESLDPFNERLYRLDVEVVGRLIQDQHV